MSRTRVATNRAGDWRSGRSFALFAAALSRSIPLIRKVRERDTQKCYIGLRVDLRDRNVFNEDAMKILVRSTC